MIEELNMSVAKKIIICSIFLLVFAFFFWPNEPRNLYEFDNISEVAIIETDNGSGKALAISFVLTTISDEASPMRDSFIALKNITKWVVDNKVEQGFDDVETIIIIVSVYPIVVGRIDEYSETVLRYHFPISLLEKLNWENASDYTVLTMGEVVSVSDRGRRAIDAWCIQDQLTAEKITAVCN